MQQIFSLNVAGLDVAIPPCSPEYTLNQMARRNALIKEAERRGWEIKNLENGSIYPLNKN